MSTPRPRSASPDVAPSPSEEEPHGNQKSKGFCEGITVNRQVIGATSFQPQPGFKVVRLNRSRAIEQTRPTETTLNTT